MNLYLLEKGGGIQRVILNSNHFFFFLTLVVSLGLKLKTVERIQSQTDIPGDYEGKKIWPKGAPWADEL